MFTAYSIGVRVALVNQASAGLTTLSNQFLATNRNAAQLQTHLNNIRRLSGLAMAGAGVAGLGFAGLGIIAHVVKPAEEYTHQLALMNAAGMEHKEIAESIGAAWKTTKDVMSSSATENLKAIRELRMVFGSTEEAIRFLPQMQKMSAILASVVGSDKANVSDVAFTAAKALELRGASRNPVTFGQQADLIVKAIIASGGKVQPRDILQAIKYAGVGGTGYSNDFLYGIMPTLTQELGGSSTGTALTSMYRAIVGGRIDNRALEAMNRLGLVDMRHAMFTTTGHLKGITSGGIKGSQLFQQNPELWVQQVLMPAMISHGFTTTQQQQAALDQIFSNRTAGRIGNILLTQAPRLMKDFNLIGKAGSSAAYDRLAKTDPVLAQMAVEKQMENLKTAFAINVVPVLIPAMIKLAHGVNDLGTAMRRHPNMMKDLVLGFTALSGAMVVGGTGASIVFTLKAAAAGMKALNAALGAGISKGGLVGALSGVTGIALRLTQLAGIAAAGYAVGTGVSDIYEWARSKWGKGGSIGTDIYDLFHPEPSPSPVRPSAQQPIQVRTQINLNGRPIADAVTDHQTRDVGRNLWDALLFDPSMSHTSPAVPLR